MGTKNNVQWCRIATYQNLTQLSVTVPEISAFVDICASESFDMPADMWKVVTSRKTVWRSIFAQQISLRSDLPVWNYSEFLCAGLAWKCLFTFPGGFFWGYGPTNGSNAKKTQKTASFEPALVKSSQAIWPLEMFPENGTSKKFVSFHIILHKPCGWNCTKFGLLFTSPTFLLSVEGCRFCIAGGGSEFAIDPFTRTVAVNTRRSLPRSHMWLHDDSMGAGTFQNVVRLGLKNEHRVARGSGLGRRCPLPSRLGGLGPGEAL